MDLLLPSLIQLFDRDLAKLEEEIKLYPTEESLWEIAGDIKNSGGNLCLHLCGNLRHFIGNILGNTGYQRNRDYEFAAKNVARNILISEVDKTKNDVHETLLTLNTQDLKKNYPVEVFGSPMTTTFFLLHLHSHLTYHLGQVNYHRRLLTQA
jgi:uncharacterized damage-inducible protein DinB